MADDRLGHLEDVAARLWPAPHVATVGARPGAGVAVPVGEYLLLPNRRSPRVLAPTGRRAAAAVVRHHGEGRQASARLKAAALALGLRSGLAPLWRERLHVSAPADAPDNTLLSQLSQILGTDVVMGMHLGPPRANRKPVLQLVSPAGTTLAYAKLGVDPLTDGLVTQETDALRLLGQTPRSVVRVAEVLHAGTWQGHPLLVQAALPVWLPRRPLTTELLLTAVREVSAIGAVAAAPLVDSSFWADLSARLALLPPGTGAERLRGLVAELGARAGRMPIALGASHGDWTPWNMACVGDTLLVWDWERFRLGVPVGADLLHHRMQSLLVSELQEPEASARRLVQDAGSLLAPIGLPPADAAVTALLYLADLAARYLTDRQHEAGARLGDVTTWLLPALADGVEHLGGPT